MEKIEQFLFKYRELSLTQEELSLHGVDLHTMDIRTGATPRDVKTHFLPRLDFPDVKDSFDLLESPFFKWGGLLDYPNYHDPMDFETWKYLLPYAIIDDCEHHSRISYEWDTNRYLNRSDSLFAIR